MAGIWELTRYVENNPGEHNQRWRLAKKLYHACEYHLALEHLTLLKEEWPGKLNVLRYLAATHYRLGQYDESIAELEAALEWWPHVVALYEQLARVFEVAGRREEAAIVWEKALRVDPDHPTARQAVKRLRTPKSASPKDQLNLQDSDSGITLQQGRVCPECGAQNSEELSRCWKCRTDLPQTQRPTPSPRQASPVVQAAAPSSQPTAAPRIFAYTLVGLIMAGALALTAWHIAPEAPPGDLPPIPITVQGVLADTLNPVRAVMGIVLIIAWPAAIRISQLFSGVTPRDKVLPIAGGVALALLTYALTWVPIMYLSYAPALLALASLMVYIAVGQAPSFFMTLGGWIVQYSLVFATSVAAFTSIEGVQPLIEFREVVHHSAAHDTDVTPGVHSLHTVHLPLRMAVIWGSTGSSWLDAQSNQILVELELEHAGENGGAVLRFSDGDNLLEHAEITGDHHSFVTRVVPGERYEIFLTGPNETRVTPIFYGVLPPRVQPPE